MLLLKVLSRATSKHLPLQRLLGDLLPFPVGGLDGSVPHGLATHSGHLPHDGAQGFGNPWLHGTPNHVHPQAHSEASIHHKGQGPGMVPLMERVLERPCGLLWFDLIRGHLQVDALQQV